MSLSTTAPAPATAARHHVPDEHADARLREAAARIATSLARFAATHSRRSTVSESPVLVEDVVAGEESHRVRGELFALAAANPVVLVTIERHADQCPSRDELRAAYGLTAVESRVAVLLAERMSNHEIAELLDVTEYTARRHTERVMRKLGVNRRTAVRHELVRCMERRRASAASAARTPGEGTSADAGPAGRPGQHASRAGAVEHGEAMPSRWLVARPRARGVRKHGTSSGQSKERIIVLLSRERERQAVSDALGDEVVVQFAAELNELHPPWVNPAPIGVLAELESGREKKLEQVLRKLRRAVPDVPVWGYAPLDRISVRQAVRLAAHGLIVDVITTVDDLEARSRVLLSDAREWSEGEALWRVWEPWVAPETRGIVAGCIEASVRSATTYQLARKMNSSLRSLSRQTTKAKLPTARRMLTLCRLLRAMHRLDHRAASVKAIASELGYPSVAALRMQLTYATGLRLSRLKSGSRFAALAEVVHAELSEPRAHSTSSASRGARSGRARAGEARARDASRTGGTAHGESPRRGRRRKPDRSRGRNS
jgi:DNA-binding CsgD family transcriptional regulator/AraC-like DNA-binding protein